MKQIRYIALCMLTAITVSLSGCSEDFLETSPTNQIPGNKTIGSLKDLYTILNGIHRKMVSQDSGSQGMGGEPGFSICRESLADDMTWKTNTWWRDLHQWVAHIDETNSYNYRMWRVYYQWVLNANFILENVDQYEAFDPALHHSLKGEALCFRAFSHFMLVQCWGHRYVAGTTNSQLGVPYRLKSSLEPMARNTVEECYQHINDDLNLAIQLLEGYKPTDINHFDQAVAFGLKARVALAQQNYTVAAEAADVSLKLALKNGNVLMNGKDDLMHGFANITTKTKEVMWAAMTKNDHTVYFYSYYANMSWNFNSTAIRQGVKTISQTTYNLMSPTDIRRQWWDPTGTASTPTDAFIKDKYQVRKFTARSTSDAVGDYAFMRLAEIYLMKAEALARSGKYAEAQETLTAFAVTRDPEYVSKGNTGDALIEEIMTHRRIELWGEGFRWFDLKRLNLPLNRTGDNFVIEFCMVKDVPADDKRWVYAIPKEEIDASEGLVKRNDF